MVKKRALLYMLLVRGLHTEINALPALLNIELPILLCPAALAQDLFSLCYLWEESRVHERH